jgi:hypothetical protein
VKALITMLENPELQITIHSGTEIRPMTVHARDALRSVLTQFPDCSQCKIIYDGHMILTAFSFSFYGMENGAHLYTIPDMAVQAPPPPKRTDTIAERICDKESFCRTFQELHGADVDADLVRKCYGNCDPQFMRQMSRLKDRFYDRVEGTVKSYRQLLKHFFSSTKKDESDSSDEEKDEPSKTK